VSEFLEAVGQMQIDLASSQQCALGCGSESASTRGVWCCPFADIAYYPSEHKETGLMELERAAADARPCRDTKRSRNFENEEPPSAPHFLCISCLILTINEWATQPQRLHAQNMGLCLCPAQVPVRDTAVESKEASKLPRQVPWCDCSGAFRPQDLVQVLPPSIFQKYEKILLLAQSQHAADTILKRFGMVLTVDERVQQMKADFVTRNQNSLMCPQCGPQYHQPIDYNHCRSFTAHQGQTMDGASNPVDNRCQSITAGVKCGFLGEFEDYLPWDRIVPKVFEEDTKEYESMEVTWRKEVEKAVTRPYKVIPGVGVVFDHRFQEPVCSTTNAGSFVIGQAYTIVTVGSTRFTVIGASTDSVGTVFIATGIGSGTGTAKTPCTGSPCTTHSKANLASLCPRCTKCSLHLSENCLHDKQFQTESWAPDCKGQGRPSFCIDCGLCRACVMAHGSRYCCNSLPLEAPRAFRERVCRERKQRNDGSFIPPFDDEPERVFAPNDRVLAPFNGRGRYPGTVQSRNPDGTYHVLFDDGDRDNQLHGRNMQLGPPAPAPLGPGGAGHPGQWREVRAHPPVVRDGATGNVLLHTNLFCNHDGEVAANCTHGPEPLRENHWSCCGGRDYAVPCAGVQAPPPPTSLGPGGAGHAGQWREVQAHPPVVRDGATGNVLLRTNLFCNHDGEAAANCTHGPEPLRENHWSCCGGRDYAVPCAGVPPPTSLGPGGAGHAGEWRLMSGPVINGTTGHVLLMSNLFCNLQGFPLAGPDHGAFCTHGRGVVRADHWSCCGGRNYAVPCGPPSEGEAHDNAFNDLERCHTQ